MFDKVKQINDLRKKAKQLEQELDAEVLEVNYKGVTVTISAGLEIKSLDTAGRSEEDIKAAVNKAIKEAQKLAAKKMRGQLGDLGLNIPGM